nr:MAG TPA: Protein of unknown function (DUF1249) [Caudoviricetes sp.]
MQWQLQESVHSWLAFCLMQAHACHLRSEWAGQPGQRNRNR